MCWTSISDTVESQIGWIYNVPLSFIVGVNHLCNCLLKANPFVLTHKTSKLLNKACFFDILGRLLRRSDVSSNRLILYRWVLFFSFNLSKLFILQIYSGTRSGKVVWEKHLLSLLPFFPKLVSQVPSNWRSRLLQV